MRIGILVVAAMLAVAIAAPQAQAHTEIAGRSPAAGASVPKAVRGVAAVFTERLRKARIVVRNAGGAQVSVGTGGIDPRNGRRIRTTLRRGLPAGRYVVSWSVQSADLHRASGTWAFRLR